MLIIGIILIGAGIALIGSSVPGLFASQAFTAYNYYEDNPDVNGLLGLMSLGALVIGLGAVLFAKGLRVKKEASKGL